MIEYITLIIIWLYTGVLIADYYPVHRTLINQLDYNVAKTLCQADVNRSDKCFENRPDRCPMSSFKQCTNNVLPLNKCDCRERSFELCSFHQQYSESCMYKAFNKLPDIKIVPDYGPSNPRIGLYHAKRSDFDEFS